MSYIINVCKCSPKTTRVTFPLIKYSYMQRSLHKISGEIPNKMLHLYRKIVQILVGYFDKFIQTKKSIESLRSKLDNLRFLNQINH